MGFAVLLAFFLSLPLCSSWLVANILDYGGIGDGRTLNTKAIVSAISAIDSSGGGTLYFPAGRWLSEPFNVTSNFELLLDASILVATNNFSLWDLIAPLPSYGQGRDSTPILWERYTSFIHGFNVSNVSITTNSSGIIHGQGHAWWEAVFDTKSICCTPGHLIEFLWSSDIRIGAPVGSPINSLILKDAPFWNVHLYSGVGAYVHDLTILSDPLYANTDGIDPDSQADTLIERVIYVGGDDGVAIKSGWDEAGIQYGVPTTNVTVRDSHFTTPNAACVCIGSEMSGGVADVFVSNITCVNTASGMYVKSAPGRGGFVENFNFADAVFVGVRVGIELSLAYGDHPFNKTLNESALPNPLSGFNVERVSGSVISPGSLLGMATAPFVGIALNDVVFTPAGGAASGAAFKWTCGNISGTAQDVSPSPCALLPPSSA